MLKDVEFFDIINYAAMEYCIYLLLLMCKFFEKWNHSVRGMWLLTLAAIDKVISKVVVPIYTSTNSDQ